MIFDLPITFADEEKLWDAFSGWGFHFKKRLREHGPDRLIRRLNRLLVLLRTSSTEMWAIDYLHFMESRDALVIIESIVPPEIWAKFESRVKGFDVELRSLWVEGETVFSKPRTPKEKYWWYYHGLPRRVAC